MARKIVLAFGVLLLLVGGVVWWRATHPPLTDAQQIVANLEDLRTSAENGSVDGIMNHLSEDFTWDGRKRSEVRSLLVFGLYEGLRKKDIRVTVTNVQPTVKGATATVTGHVSVAERSSRGFVPDPIPGTFTTEWEKRDGEWKITRAQGAQNLQQ